MKQGIKVKLPKCLGFEFKPQHVNGLIKGEIEKPMSKVSKHNNIIILNIFISNSSNSPTVHQTYYEMTATTSCHS
jgi:hypothetical protein